MSTKLNIQRALAKGYALTPLSALRRFGCLSLSQRIGELKREGWPIRREMVNRAGKRFARYWINVERVRM